MKNVEKKNIEKLETYKAFIGDFLLIFAVVTIINAFVNKEIPDFSVIICAIGIFSFMILKGIIVAVKIIHTSIKYWAHMTMIYVTYYLDRKDPNIYSPKPDLIKTMNHLSSVLKMVDDTTHSKSFDGWLKDYQLKKKIEEELKDNKK